MSGAHDGEVLRLRAAREQGRGHRPRADPGLERRPALEATPARLADPPELDRRGHHPSEAAAAPTPADLEDLPEIDPEEVEEIEEVEPGAAAAPTSDLEPRGRPRRPEDVVVTAALPEVVIRGEALSGPPAPDAKRRLAGRLRRRPVIERRGTSSRRPL
jgi:hypothetical protein